MIHHAETAAQPMSQSTPNRTAPGRRRSTHHARASPAGTHAASVAVALTAPRQATARTDAAILDPVNRPATSGARIQGASATGQASEEMAPRVVSIRGESA